MKYHTILFDLDGTLLDTLDDLANSVNYALSFHEYPKRTKEEVKSFVGNGVSKLMERAMPKECTKEEVKNCLATFRSYYLKHMYDFTRIYDEIEFLLHSLKEKGCKLAIVSNKLDDAVKELNSRFFKSYIKTAIGTPKEAKKPNPYCIFAAVKELDSSLDDCIYIGDSDVDLETAANAKIPCIGVSWGFRGRKFLEEHGAVYIADTPKKLFTLLLEL